MNVDDFYNLIIIDEEDKPKALHYIKYRGLDENIYVAKYLTTYKNSKPTYSEVATAFRYDKRIRRVVYKYIGLIEETIRAFLCNNYPKYDDLPECGKCKILQKELNKCVSRENTYDVIPNCLFSTILKVYFEIKEKEECRKEDLLIDYNDTNRKALLELRNQIGHNRFLLSNMSLKYVDLGNGIISSTLLSNLYNILNCLPEHIGEEFVKEINECSKKKSNRFDNQTTWNLLENIVITLDINKRIK